MSYLFDIIMVAVFAISIIISYKRGLVLTVLSLSSVIIALVAAQLLSPYVTAVLEKTELDERIASSISERIALLYDEHVEEDIKKSCEEILVDMNLPDSIAGFVAGKMSDIDETETFEENIKKISVAAAGIVVNLISYIIIATIVAVALLAVVSAVKLVRLIPAVKTLDNAGGALVGILLGGALVYVICIAACMCAIVFKSGTVSETVGNSIVISIVDRLGALISVL